jgi:hypothetical protein
MAFKKGGQASRTRKATDLIQPKGLHLYGTILEAE